MNNFNFNNRNHNEIYVPATHADQLGLNRHIAKVYGWTFMGLLVTALTVLFMINGLANNFNVFAPILNAGLIVSIGQIIFVMVFVARIASMRPTTAKIMYLFYSASMGIIFTWVALSFDMAIISQAFVITAISFGAMAAYGIISKQDLTSFRNILFTALIGLIVATIVNIFMRSDMLDMIISVSGVFIFLAFTVYDSAKIKHLYATSVDSNGQATALTENLAVYSALSLYLNFINLFMFILRLLNRNSR